MLRRRISFCKSSADVGRGGGEGERLLFGHSTRLSLVSSQWEPGNDKDNGHHEQTAGGRGRGDEDDSLGRQLSREEEDDSFREQLFFNEVEDDSFSEQLSLGVEEDSCQRRYIHSNIVNIYCNS